MSFKTVPNEVIRKVEQLIKTGATYKEIKEQTGASDGTITRVKQGKITSARIVTPQCENREEELSVLYNNQKEKYEELVGYARRLKEKYEKLEEKLNSKEKEKNFFEAEYYKYKKRYEEEEYYYNNLKNDYKSLESKFKALSDKQHNNLSVVDKEEPKTANNPIEDMIKSNSFGKLDVF